MLAVIIFKSLDCMYSVSCMYTKVALNTVCMAVCCLYMQYHDVVLHLTEDGCSLEAVGQETEEAVVSVTDTAIGQHHGVQRICM